MYCFRIFALPSWSQEIGLSRMCAARSPNLARLGPFFEKSNRDDGTKLSRHYPAVESGSLSILVRLPQDRFLFPTRVPSEQSLTGGPTNKLGKQSDRLRRILMAAAVRPERFSGGTLFRAPIFFTLSLNGFTREGRPR